MVLKPYFLHGFKTKFVHRKTEGPGLKPYEKIWFSELLKAWLIPRLPRSPSSYLKMSSAPKPFYLSVVILDFSWPLFWAL